MTAFDTFEFDRENEIVTLGAGQTWGEYHKKMEAATPDYAGIISLSLPCGSELLLIGGCRHSRRVPNALHWNWRIHSLRWIFVAFGRIRVHV